MSASPANSMARNLRIAGTLLLLGLLVTIVSLIWKSPLSFLMFAGIGGLLVLLGVALYLFSLASIASESP